MRQFFKTYRFCILLFSAVFFLFPSCEKEGPECYQPNQVSTKINFKSKILIHKDTIIDSVLVDTNIVSYKDTLFNSPVLTSINMPQNIMIFGNKYDNYISMPLNSDDSIMRYALQYDTTKAIYDTLTYYYHSSIHFISNVCGFTHYFHIDSFKATHHLIDSIVVNDPKVGEDASVRQITLYFFNP